MLRVGGEKLVRALVGLTPDAAGHAQNPVDEGRRRLAGGAAAQFQMGVRVDQPRKDDRIAEIDSDDIKGFRRPNRGTSDAAPKEIQTFSLANQKPGQDRKSQRLQ